ncbi:sporulation protein YqfD [Tumebacillus sp. ITR2]|uniref:Sporulation protein YqfD n=1 Tax=Tumebacillus amylolyticus TaxID=2801339 RepID=A0ABS1JDN0_9BACL|nr:sporulation protein YqfD [Tumebacillus amylolyticus]MBL0388353.1 sporulation protein YqfD [Tumebacillus amylolyticus]
MLGRWLLDFWRGYVVLTVRGEAVPEMLNRATQAGIELWEISQTKGNTYRLRMHRDDVKSLRSILRETHTRIHFERKLGVPFLAWRAWRRKFFLAGALTFLVSFYVITSMVWNIEVTGDLKRVSPETVEEVAKEVGIYRGAWKGKLPDTDILQTQLLDKLPQLSWVGVQVQGTKVTIQAVDKIPGTTPQPTNPQNIVSPKKATVREIFVHKGKAAVVRGQVVQVGQVLINGSLGNKSVHAAGIIKAETWYRSDLTIPLQAESKAYTGNSVEKHFLTFWGHPVQIWGYGQIPFQEMETDNDDKALTIGSFTFPIQYRHAVYKETQTQKAELTEAEALDLAKEFAKADVLTKVGKNGVVESQNVLQRGLKDGKLEISILNKAIEEIGQPQEFTPQAPADPQAKKQ